MESTISLSTDLTAKKQRSKRRKNLYMGLLFTSPVLLGYAIFIAVPLVLTFILSFTNYSIGAQSTKFIGLSNFTDMFTGKDVFFYPAMKATAYYVFVSVPLGIIVAFLAAVLLNQKIKARGFFRGVFYLPVIIPIASSGIIWMWMLQPDFGVINYLLGLVGLPPYSWLASDTSVMPTLILFSLWTCGSTIVIFLAGLQSIPSHLYEALEVDGGNAWHKLIYITIPVSSPIIFFNTVIGFINGLQTFVQPAVMTGGSGSSGVSAGGPNNASLLYVLYIFQNSFKFSKMGAASASAVILFIISILFTVLIFKFSKSWIHYEGDGKAK
ncbi:multiple sugar transport system permease protein [Paenibacillus sp. V4I9]|uniref:carbohydrate ABC transporter permease n=1 Tax=Paenibacillus sp. V4I9 TaxID=3042308 RepID=UPI0027860DDC|nr:sugar ABC transporter permease [Paenibacillus sp. V4I9]MDQ0886750.1 multiple sugar transport system permease protein [Paenibacillus sp. V4I9]